MDSTISDSSVSKKTKEGKLELRAGKKYCLGQQIGKGSFGQIFQGTNEKTGKAVAMKLEQIGVRYPQLQIESRFYKCIQGTEGFPVIKWCGTEGTYNVMVMELLGPSLEELLKFCNQRFSLKTVLLLAHQLLTRLESVHARSFIHRDIKPDNMVMGIVGPKRSIVHLIDFGLVKKFRDVFTQQHILYAAKAQQIGTLKFASMQAETAEQSRRDDLESLGYSLMYFLRGSLPWEPLRSREEMLAKKKATTVEALCEGHPAEFVQYFHYCQALRFEEDPDYAYLRQLFRNLYHRNGFRYDRIFDWNL